MKANLKNFPTSSLVIGTNSGIKVYDVGIDQLPTVVDDNNAADAAVAILQTCQLVTEVLKIVWATEFGDLFPFAEHIKPLALLGFCTCTLDEKTKAKVERDLIEHMVATNSKCNHAAAMFKADDLKGAVRYLK